MAYNPELVRQELAKKEFIQKSSSWKHAKSRSRLISEFLQRNQMRKNKAQ